MRRTSLLVLVLAVTPLIAVFAEEPGGKVEGAVTLDGSPLPGTTITLESSSLHLTQVTGANGRFEFLNVPPGAGYRLSADLIGLKTVRKKNVAVLGGKTTEFALRMRIDPSYVVCVDCGSAIPLLPEGPSFVITREMMDTLPIH